MSNNLAPPVHPKTQSHLMPNCSAAALWVARTHRREERHITTIFAGKVGRVHWPARRFARLTKAPRGPSRHATPILVGYAAI